MNKLVLGTAQFGMDYGINNKRGKIPREEVFEILKTAFEAGIDSLDTAYAYGDSEIVIGDFIKSSGLDIKVISKLPVCDPEDVVNIFSISSNRLSVDSLYGYYIHSFQHYRENPEVWDVLARLKSEGKIKKIGFSLYYPSELDYLLDNDITFDIIQVPYSVFDQRFGGYFPTLKAKSIEVYVRSVFLQGLLFKDPSDLSGNFRKVKARIQKLNLISKELDLPLASLVLNFAVLNNYVDRVVVGVDNIENLNELLTSVEHVDKVKPIISELLAFREDDENIILPVNWR
ncbi:aldo/keto reductase [Methanosarcina sp. 1.H.T.1A.1]|uniref:aldo/keto reductase n=1 Tax=Methanosarcina sp. 1.H.T.1A.1 TaxID=1483602 RepID=UPI001F2251D2|nr:aldo/keto reductase [Methanosarcina sp. 1.H.T.1A.1]